MKKPRSRGAFLCGRRPLIYANANRLATRRDAAVAQERRTDRLHPIFPRGSDQMQRLSPVRRLLGVRWRVLRRSSQRWNGAKKGEVRVAGYAAARALRCPIGKTIPE